MYESSFNDATDVVEKQHFYIKELEAKLGLEKVDHSFMIPPKREKDDRVPPKPKVLSKPDDLPRRKFLKKREYEERKRKHYKK